MTALIFFHPQVWASSPPQHFHTLFSQDCYPHPSFPSLVWAASFPRLLLTQALSMLPLAPDQCLHLAGRYRLWDRWMLRGLWEVGAFKT